MRQVNFLSVLSPMEEDMIFCSVLLRSCMWQTSSADCPLGLLAAFWEVAPGMEHHTSHHFALFLPRLFLISPSLSWTYTSPVKCQHLNGVPRAFLVVLG